MSGKYTYSFQFIIGAILMAATLMGNFLVKKNIRDFDQMRFKSVSNQVEEQIKNRMEIYINALLQTRSMFAVTADVDSQEYKGYVQTLEITEKYPGIQGVGFTKRIRAAQLKAHELSFQKVHAGYKVWPAFRREEYFSIIYLEPMNWRNKRAIGYDMFTHPIRRIAMEKARDTGRAAMSGLVELFQETKNDRQTGFLIYVPVYQREKPVITVEQRRKHLIGFIYSPFRSKDLFQHIMSPLKDIHFNVEISSLEGGAPKLLYASTRSKRHQDNELVSERILSFAQQSWKIKILSTSSFRQRSGINLPLIILVLGTMISLLVTWFLIRNARHEKVLKNRSLLLEKLNEASRTLTAELNLQDLLQKLTDIGLELSGANFGAFFYNTINEKGEAYVLYTVSGVPREEFTKFPMPRNTEVFAPTFAGKTVLSPDITKDPRFGKNPPYSGLPAGHLPVKSYLAVGVKSRSGEVIGGLFYGHPQAGRFTEHEKSLIEGLAPQAAIAIDNAQLYQSAKQAIAAREEFLSIASHELKTPITSMKLQFETAQRMMSKENDEVYARTMVQRRVSSTLKQLGRMTKLIDDMLDYSRISLDQFKMKKESFDLGLMLKDIVERYEEQFKEEGIKFTQHMKNDNLMITGDEYRIEQVISNLLNNAIKYGNKSPVDLTLQKSDQMITISIEDQGKGIPPESLSRIFKRYERISSASNVSGLGLGLYISNKIVEAHGGKIDVDSVPGKYTRFTVNIPLAV